MARNFDGANDNIDCGSDASIDAYTTLAAAFWMQNNSPLDTVAYLILGKDRFATRWAIGNTGTAGDRIHFGRSWSGATAEWRAQTALGTTKHHVVVVYDGGATTNDPVIYIDGVSETVTEISAPSGTLNSDATQALRMGENASNALDWNGRACHVCYDDTIANWTAAAVNRAKWWGRPHGGLKVYHPFLTSKLTNEGTATATGTATGSTMVSLVVPVVRPGTVLLGMGVGW